MNKKLPIALVAAFLAACSSAYIVPDGASTTQVFLEACSGCHKAKERPDIYFRLKAAVRNPDSISAKIQRGGLIMPAFPNLDESQLQQLSHYVLEHSVAK